MSVFTTATIEHFKQVGEVKFVNHRPCIIDRIAIALVAGTGRYTLPDYVQDIRRVTYQGWKVYPMPHRELRQSYLSGTQQSRPMWYIFNNIGQQQIQLFPVPSLATSLVPNSLDLWGPAISSAFIIEFFRMPDYSAFIMPRFIRRRYLKTYVNMRTFEVESKGQNLKAVKYYNSKHSFLRTIYEELLDDLNNKPRNLVATDSGQRPYGYVPPPPILPVDRYGISVDEPGW